jgi:TatD DNase family protein
VSARAPALRLYDSHCHLHDRDVAPEATAQLARALEGGVERLLLAGVDEPGWRDEIELAARHPQLRLCFGVHPQVVGRDPGRAMTMVESLGHALGSGGLPRPAALGETGLDGSEEHAPSLPMQARLFRRHLELARAHGLPLVLHVLRAHPLALDILEAEALPPRPGVLHSCSASAELCARYLALGFHVSFSGAVANPAARKLHAAARSIPLERLLVETDAPFQTPVARRPGRNEPAFLVEIVAALAQIRGEPVDWVAQATFDNARRLFDEE